MEEPHPIAPTTTENPCSRTASFSSCWERHFWMSLSLFIHTFLLAASPRAVLKGSRLVWAEFQGGLRPQNGLSLHRPRPLGPSIIRYGNDGPGDRGECQARATTLGLYLLPAHYVTLSKSLPLSGSQFLRCQMRVDDDRTDCLGAGCLPPHLAPKLPFSETSIKA